MDEIRALPWNGFTVASTFSGAGGSCLGYRMAGFRVAWASEFIDAAAETYRANAPGTVLDTRDIRDVKPGEVLSALGMEAGELDLLDGSPPCASFSTAGKREAGWGQVKAYSDTRQRTDDLFFEYARLLEGIRPRVFVAENVSGLVKGTAKGYFKLVLARLRECGYRVEARVLDASWLGVPQARQRLIFTGVRDDLGVAPVFPSPLPYQYTVRDALPWIAAQGDNAGFGSGSMRRSDYPSPTLGATPQTGNGRFPPSVVTVEHNGGGTYSKRDVTDRPAGTIWVGHHGSAPWQLTVTGANGITHDPETGERVAIKAPPGTRGLECRKLTLGELRRLGGFPDDFILTGTYPQRWERIGRAVPPVMMAAIATAVRDRVLIPLRETASA